MESLQTTYDKLVSLTKEMLKVQAEYFDGKKKGYNEPHKLQACRVAEEAAKDYTRPLYLYKLSGFEQPTNNPILLKDYNTFLDTVAVLHSLQTKYFKDTKDKDLLSQCKAIENKVRNLIKKYNQKPANLLF